MLAPAPTAAPDAGASAELAEHAGVPACANCGTPAAGDYCPACGQEQRGYHRSLRAIVGEALDGLAGWDGKIPATLWALLRHPGALTAAFLAGRRVRYVRPLRLYLSASAAFFLALAATGRDGSLAVVKVESRDAARSPARVVAPAAPAAARDDGVVSRWYRERKRALFELPPAQRQRVLSQAFVAKLPTTVFLLVPLFALLLRGLYRRAPVFYAEHLVFALHVHAYGMVVLAAAQFARAPWAVAALGGALAYLLAAAALPARLHGAAAPVAAAAAAAAGFGAGAGRMEAPLLAVPVYLFMALRGVYGGSRRRTAAKLAALGGAYGAAFLFATAVTAVLSLLVF
jgi:hypothetical protein